MRAWTMLLFAALLVATQAIDVTKLKETIVYGNDILSFTEATISTDATLGKTIVHGKKRHERNIYTDPNHLWPNGRVPFIFDENMPAFTIVEILAAMQEIETSCYSGHKFCILFVPRQDETDYIHISWTSGTAGATNIGRAGGKQDMTVNSAGGRGHDDNLYILMLALGGIPEVMRPDRDTYLDVNTGNAATTDPFRYLTGVGTGSFGQPFDYESLLLQSPYLYARDHSTPVISAKQANHVLGQGVSLTPGDATLLQHAYHCAVDSSNVVNLLGTMPLECHFHTDTCTLNQDTNDNFNWVVQAGPTPTTGTGPIADYSSGSGKFALAQAAGHHNQKARLISQQFPAGQYCLRTNLHMYGSDVGTLRISAVPTGEAGVDVLNKSGSLGNQWYHIYLTVTSKAPFTLQFEATIGNGDHGDIAIDDVYFYNGKCIEW